MKKLSFKKSSKIVNRSILCVLIVLILAIPTGAVSINLNSYFSTNLRYPPIFSLGDTIIVDDDGTGDYTSIQDAIDNAAPNDYIIVKAGTYGDQLTIDVPGLTISAASGEFPTIYVSSYNVGIDVTAADILLQGFEIFGNGSLVGGPYPTIRASAGAIGLTVNQNRFKVFTGELGQIALLMTAGVTNGNFTNNVVSTYKKGVVLESNSEAIIIGNSFNSVEFNIYHAAYIIGTTHYLGSIQSSLDRATSNQTIKVLGGTFTENVVISKSITLNGLKSGVNPVAGRTGEETIVDGNTNHAITIATGVTNVKIDGFTITISNKQSAANGAGVIISMNAKKITIINNIIRNITDGSGADTLADETYGIMVYGRDPVGGQSKINITHNYIHDVEEYGIAINDKTSNVTIEGNHITNLIGSDHSDLPDPSWPSYFCSGIHLGGQVGPIFNITIDDNSIITNNTGDGQTTVAGGGITFAGVADWLDPSRVWEGFQSIFILHNEIYNNTMGILSLAGYFNNSPEIHANNLSGNRVFGINNTITNISFIATNNWWGHISGPYHPTTNPSGTGVNVSDNVTFWPWYEFDGYSIPPTVEYNVGLPNANGGMIIKDTTQIEIIAHDYESGLKSLTYRTWDASSRWSAWVNYTNKFTLSGDGPKMVQLNATDNAGTMVLDTEVHIVDTTPPVVHVQYPNGGEFLRGDVPILWDAADKTPDQQQKNWNYNYALTSDFPGHLQSFQPTENNLNSVQLLLYGDNANVTVRVFSNITPVPIQIAQSTQHLQNIGNPSNPVWVDFPLNTVLDLDTDKTYYIGVTQEIYGNIGFKWYYYDSTGDVDAYDYGQAWLRAVDQLISHPEWDWCFKTMFWENNVGITIEYSPTGVAPFSTIDDSEVNDGSYTWDTSPYPDGNNYRIRVVAKDFIDNMGADISDNKFMIDNTGPSVSDIIITDTTIGRTDYTKNGDTVEITATIEGNPIMISADLSGLGKGTDVPPTSFTGTTARWEVTSILCSPPDGTVTVSVISQDSTGDISGNAGTIISDNTLPTIEIIRPRPGVYFMDSQRLLPFSYPLVIGQITLRAEAVDNSSGIKEVEFYIEDILRANVSAAPYEWLWDEASFGFFQVEVIAYDNVGHQSSYILRDLFIINFDIF
jgi:hypothetical protein